MSETTPAARPAPLTPANCDLQDFAFMPLDVARLRSSDMSATSTADEFMAAVLLWCAAWHQVPAASIPDDDRVLAQLAGLGRDVRGWNKVKGGAMRGWILCSDGRYYHPVVAEKALESWIEKLAARLRGGVGNLERWGTPFDRAPLDAAMTQAKALLEAIHPGSRTLRKRIVDPSKKDATGNPSRIGKGSKKDSTDDRNRQGHGQGHGHGQGVKRGGKTAGSADGPSPGAVAFEAYREAYLERYKTEPLLNAKVRSQFKQFVDLVGAEDAPTLAAFYVGHPDQFYARKAHDPGSLVTDASKLRTEWQTRTQLSGVPAGATGGRAARAEAWHAGMDDIPPDSGLFDFDHQGGAHAANGSIG